MNPSFEHLLLHEDHMFVQHTHVNVQYSKILPEVVGLHSDS